MDSKEANLPPKWVTLFSWLFLVYLLAPVFAALRIFSEGGAGAVSGFGLDLTTAEDPLHWLLGIDIVMFAGGLTGFFILTKRRLAYDFGIFYCVLTFGITLPANFFVGDWDSDAWLNIMVQYFLLGCFFVHLLRNRALWRTKIANKTEQTTPNGAPVL